LQLLEEGHADVAGSGVSMAKVALKNLTRRPVSFRGNSGTYTHLPPHHSLELDAVEVEDNAMVGKLVARGVLSSDKAHGAPKPPVD
jgi:hypothetical protein